MHVLSIAFPDVPVGTAVSGGAEQILSILESGLSARGHRSLVIAAKGSRVTGELIETPGPDTSPQTYRNAIESVLARDRIDLIHFHGLDFSRYLPECEIPMLATLHLPVSFYPDWIFDGRPAHLNLNCVSRSQANSSPASRGLPVIPNGIPTGSYLPAEPEDYLLWMGRICPEKGAHIALEVAHQLGARLIIAGPVHAYSAHQEYFSQSIRPRLDNLRIYAGAVDGAQKRWLLSHAKCLLLPSLVAETSSLIAMEALSSGTPVVAFRAGALPEIVTDGEIGFLVGSATEMAGAVLRIHDLSRSTCHRQALRRFDSGPMIAGYLEHYGRITTRHLATGCAPHSNL